MLGNLSAKVTLGVMLFFVALVAIATTSLHFSQVTAQATARLGTITLVEATLNEELIFRLARTMTEVVSAGAQLEPDELDEAEENLAASRAILAELTSLQIDHVDQSHAELNAQRLALIERLDEILAQLTAAIEAEDRAAVAELLEGLEEVDAAIEELIAVQTRVIQSEATTAVALVEQNARAAGVAIPVQYTVLGLLAALASWLLHRMIVRPVRALASAATAVGEGRFDEVLAKDGIDEVGTLQRAFAVMVERLRERDQAVAAQMEETRHALDELEIRSAEQASLVAAMEQQREVISSLSVPVLPISQRVLVMPLVGAMDAERQLLVQEQALKAIERTRATTLLLDVTGVPVVDEAVAKGLLRVVSSAALLGTRVVLVGIRPEVAQAMVALDIPLAFIRSQSSLQAGIEEALAAEQRTWARHTLGA